MDKIVSRGYGVTTAGFVLLLAGAGLEYAAIPAAMAGNGLAALGLTATGMPLLLAGPILTSAGATYVQGRREELRVLETTPHNWRYYKAGLFIQILGTLSNFIPVKIPVYQKTRYDEYGDPVSRTEVSISPIPLGLSFVSQILYCVNARNAYSYLREARGPARHVDRTGIRWTPQCSYRNGRWSAGILFGLGG